MTNEELSKQIVIIYPQNSHFNNTQKTNIDSTILSTYHKFRELEKIYKRIFVFPHWKRYLGHPFGDDTGYMFDLSIPWHTSRAIEETGIRFSGNKEYDFLIVLGASIFEDCNDIETVMIIAHEFQHVIQSIFYRCVHLKCNVLFNYFISINIRENSFYFKIPHEYDARRRAKKICCEIYGEKKVNEFIKFNSINREYWNFIDKIDSNGNYDIQKETDYLWAGNYDKLKIEIQKNANKELIQSYQYYVHECPDK